MRYPPGMRKSVRSSRPHPVRNLGGTFAVRRDLLRPIHRFVMTGVDLPVEYADILMELFGARHLGWTEPESCGEGFVRFQTLLDSLVHDAGMFSRRIAALEKAGFLETRKAHQVPGMMLEGLHRNTQVARITPAGRRKIAPVWRRYKKVAERISVRASPAQLDAHYEVIQLFREEIRREWPTATELKDQRRRNSTKAPDHA